MATKRAGLSVSPDAAAFLAGKDADGTPSVLWAQVERVRMTRLECKDPDQSYDVQEIDVRLGHALYIDLLSRS